MVLLCGVEVIRCRNERRFYHPLSWGLALFYEEVDRWEVTVGVILNNEGAPRVVTSEIPAVLADSLLVESLCCLAYVNFTTTTIGSALHRAEGSVVV